MNVQQILKQHSKKETSANSIGIACEVFKDYTLIPTVKNLNKRVSLLFTDADGDSIRVNASKSVNDMYRANQITLREMLGMPVYMVTTNAQGEPLTDQVTGQPITMFVIGTNGGQSVGKVGELGIDKYVPKIVDLKALA